MAWNADLAKGKKGEAIVASTLSNRGWNIITSSYDKLTQDGDSDLIVEKGKIKREIEVKYDGRMHETGNICLENLDTTSGKKGWWQTIQADYLFFLCQKTHDMYAIRVADLKEYVAKYPPRKVYTYDSRWDGRHRFENFLVSLSALENRGCTVQKIKGVM